MICERCEGEGFLRGIDLANPGALVILPCLECNGSGVGSCCDAAGSSPAKTFCETCGGRGSYWNGMLGELRPCPDCAIFASNVEKKSDMGPAVAGEAPLSARGVEEGRGDLLGSADHPLVSDEPGDLDPSLGERMRREDDENVNEPNPKGVQNLPHETPPMAGEVNAGVFALSANRVNAAKAAYFDSSQPWRDCNMCGMPYRGPAVYCSLSCAMADA